MTRHSRIRYPPRPALPELDEVDPPMLLPGDRPVDRGEIAGRPALLYRLDGSPIDPAAVTPADLWSPEFVIGRRCFYRGGTQVLVSTVFLGSDTGLGLSLAPVLWETMIFLGGGTLGPQWRYLSRHAALHGHRVVCAALSAATRTRRTARCGRAPAASSSEYRD